MEISFIKKFVVLVFMVVLILAIGFVLLNRYVKRKPLSLETDEACLYGRYPRLAKKTLASVDADKDLEKQDIS